MWLGNKKMDDKKTDSEGRERSSQVLNFLRPYVHQNVLNNIM